MRLLTKLVLLGCVGSLPLSTTHGQRRPLVMVHGIRSEPATWDQDRASLVQSFPLFGLAPSVPWQQRQQTQAAALNTGALANLPSTSIAFGHSNGGIVLRQAVASGANLAGLLTVGSLHLGAPAAQNVMSGSMQGIAEPVFNDILNFAFSFATSTIDYEDFFYVGLMTYAAHAVATSVYDIFLPKVGFDRNDPLWATMYPSSAYIQSLQSAATQSTEIAAIPQRAFIRT